LLWKYWTVFLIVGDSLAGVGLLIGRRFGEIAWLLVAISQLVAYLGFSEHFGEQGILIWFHVFTLSIGLTLKAFTRSR
jgi:hypothetical protein